MKRLDLDIPEEVIIDQVTGLAINIPLGDQVPAGWEKANPAKYQHILAMRAANGVEVADDMFRDTPTGNRVDALQARIDADGTQDIVDRIRAKRGCRGN